MLHRTLPLEKSMRSSSSVIGDRTLLHEMFVLGLAVLVEVGHGLVSADHASK